MSPGVVVAGAAGGLPSLVAVPLARAGSPALVAPHVAECLHLLVTMPLTRGGAQAVGAPSVCSILKFAGISAEGNICVSTKYVGHET